MKSSGLQTQVQKQVTVTKYTMITIIGKKMIIPPIQNQETPNFKPSIPNGWSPIKAYTHKTKYKDRKETKSDQVCSGTQSVYSMPQPDV
jgi:hypothetical protein